MNKRIHEISLPLVPTLRTSIQPSSPVQIAHFCEDISALQCRQGNQSAERLDKLPKHTQCTHGVPPLRMTSGRIPLTSPEAPRGHCQGQNSVAETGMASRKLLCGRGPRVGWSKPGFLVQDLNHWGALYPVSQSPWRLLYALFLQHTSKECTSFTLLASRGNFSFFFGEQRPQGGNISCWSFHFPSPQQRHSGDPVAFQL